MAIIERAALDDVARADETGDEFRAWPLVDVLWRARLFDLARVHHGDNVGGGHRFRLVVGDIDRGVAVFVVQAAHLEAHLFAQIGIEIRERFVQKECLGLDDEGARERHALLLAAREFARVAIGEAAEVGGIQNRGEFAIDGGAVELAQLESIGDVFGNRHVRPQRIALKNHRHVAPLRRQRPRRRRYQLVADPNFAGRRLDEARDQPQRRRLAATGRPEQADQPAVLDGERHVVDDRNLSITLGQAPQFNRRHARPPRRPAGCSAAAVFGY